MSHWLEPGTVAKRAVVIARWPWAWAAATAVGFAVDHDVRNVFPVVGHVTQKDSKIHPVRAKRQRVRFLGRLPNVGVARINQKMRRASPVAGTRRVLVRGAHVAVVVDGVG